jgi:hypothetical protein
MRHFRWLMLCIVFACALAGASDFGEFQGALINPNGTRPPGIGVVIRNIKTGDIFTSATNEDGNFEFRLLPVGKYTVSIEGLDILQELFQVKIVSGKSTSKDVRLPDGYHLIGGCQVLLVIDFPPVCCGYLGQLETIYTRTMLSNIPASSRNRSIQGVLNMTGGVSGR